jgi:hypothetical protein
MSILPVSGKADMEMLAAAIRTAPAELGVSPVAALVSLRYLDGNRWLNLGTALYVGWQHESADIRVGGLRLLARNVRLSNIRGAQDLDSLLRIWPKIDRRPEAGEFQESFNVFRASQRSSIGGLPGWFFNLHCARSEPRNGALPRGPFFQPNADFFASDISDAASQWLALGGESWDPHDDYRVVIKDERAYFQDVIVEKKSVTVTVTASSWDDLYCCGTLEGYAGGVTQVVEKLAGDQIILNSEELIQSVSLGFDTGRHTR